jgi:hypothetical protein
MQNLLHCNHPAPPQSSLRLAGQCSIKDEVCKPYNLTTGKLRAFTAATAMYLEDFYRTMPYGKAKPAE